MLTSITRNLINYESSTFNSIFIKTSKIKLIWSNPNSNSVLNVSTEKLNNKNYIFIIAKYVNFG